MISKYLLALKEVKGYSNQKIAELSKTSVSTIDRILSGKAKSTSFEILRDVTFVLGGNMDDLARAVDSTPSVNPETFGDGPELPTVPEKARELATAADLNILYDMFSGLLRDKDANYDRHIQALHRRHAEDIANLKTEHERELAGLIRAHERECGYKNKWITWLFIICLCLVAFLTFVVIYDVLNPEIGWVRKIGALLLGDSSSAV